MDMTSQGYPLECSTEDGQRWLVVGWFGGADPYPVVVPLDGPGGARTESRPVEYRRPSEGLRLVHRPD
jgi:hypothetical protein